MMIGKCALICLPKRSFAEFRSARASGFLLDTALHGAYRSRIALTEGWRKETRDAIWHFLHRPMARKPYPGALTASPPRGKRRFRDRCKGRADVPAAWPWACSRIQTRRPTARKPDWAAIPARAWRDAMSQGGRPRAASRVRGARRLPQAEAPRRSPTLRKTTSSAAIRNAR